MKGILTPRQIEIISMVAEDMTGLEIADKLGLAYKSVRFHRDNINKKLGVKSAAGAVVKAHRLGLIDLDGSID